MDSVKIQEIQLFRDHLAVFEREQGLQKITVHRLPSEGQPLNSLQAGRSVSFVDPVYKVDTTESEFSSSVLRFCYSSLKTPPSVYDYDMDSGTSVIKKIDTVSKPLFFLLLLQFFLFFFSIQACLIFKRGHGLIFIITSCRYWEVLMRQTM